MPLSIYRVASRFAFVLMLGLAAAAAATFTEIGDAPNLFSGGPGPQNAGSGVDAIDGTISEGDPGDLFKLSLPAGSLTIRATATGGGLDPQIYLFDALGAGIASNDDADATTGDAELALSLVAGTHVLGIGDWPTQALDNDPGTQDAWDGTPTPPSDFSLAFIILHDLQNPTFGPYTVYFQYGTAPEPGTVATLLISLIGMLALSQLARLRR